MCLLLSCVDLNRCAMQTLYHKAHTRIHHVFIHLVNPTACVSSPLRCTRASGLLTSLWYDGHTSTQGKWPLRLVALPYFSSVNEPRLTRRSRLTCQVIGAVNILLFLPVVDRPTRQRCRKSPPQRQALCFFGVTSFWPVEFRVEQLLTSQPFPK